MNKAPPANPPKNLETYKKYGFCANAISAQLNYNYRTNLIKRIHKGQNLPPVEYPNKFL